MLLEEDVNQGQPFRHKFNEMASLVDSGGADILSGSGQMLYLNKLDSDGPIENLP